MIEIDGRHLVTRRQRDDRGAVGRVECIRQNDEAAARFARQCGEDRFDFVFAMNRSSAHLNAGRGTGRLDRRHVELHGGRRCRIEQNRHAHGVWRNLLQQLDPFAALRRIVDREAGKVSTRSREVRGETAGNRISDIHEHDRNGLRLAGQRGDPTPGGSIAEAYSQALGYSHGFEFQKAVRAKDPDFFERDRLARIKLLEKFGVSWESEWKEIVEAFNRMEAGFSERYKEMSRLPEA